MYFGKYIEEALMVLQLANCDIYSGNTERHLWYSSSFRELHRDFRCLIYMIQEGDRSTKVGYLDLLRSIGEELPRMKYLIDYLIDCAREEELPKDIISHF